MEYKTRNGCPFAFSMSTFGDKWTLLILREIIFMKGRYYDDFIKIEEAISTNILADRLRDMEKRRLITRRKDQANKRRWIYEPTEKALDLLPMLFELAIWSAKYDPYTGITKSHLDIFTKRRAKTIKELRQSFAVTEG